MQDEAEEIGETAPSDLWSPKQLDRLSLWYFQQEDKTKLLSLEGTSVDALVTPPDPANLKTEFVSAGNAMAWLSHT